MPNENPVPVTVPGAIQYWPEQSPIDLASAIKANFPTKYLRFKYPDEVVGVFKKNAPPNDHGFDLVIMEGDAIVILDGQRCHLKKIHFHARSEHRVGDRDFPLELHLVHEIEDPHFGSTHAVVGVFVNDWADKKDKQKSKDLTPKSFLDLNRYLASPQHAENMKMRMDGTLATGEEPPLGDIPFNPKHCLTNKRQFYRYEGSLTTAPYTEGISWVVLRKPVSVVAADIEEIKKYATHQARQPQELGRRFVLQSF